MATQGLIGSSWTNQVRTSGATAPRAGGQRPPASSKRALELVALRGRDVIGVRHLLDGARACLGHGSEAFARISVGDPTARDFAVGEVNGEEFLVHVPPRARVRSHLANGLGQLGVGPQTISLAEGERSVIVLPGGIQIRAQIVPVETFSRSLAGSSSSMRWLAVVGALYVGALAFCASMVPERASALAEGSMQRVVHAITSQTIAATRGL